MRASHWAAVAAAVLFVSVCIAPIYGEDLDIPPLPMDPGSYVTLELDGTHPYGESHSLELGIDLEFSHYEDCAAVYITHGWQRPAGGGAKTHSDVTGTIDCDLCEEEDTIGVIFSGSTGRVGDIIDLGDGEYIIDFSATGGKTRKLKLEP